MSNQKANKRHIQNHPFLATMKMACVVLVLSGCSTIGDLEPLNGTPLEGVREVANTLGKVQNISGGSSGSQTNRLPLNTSAINSKYGELQGLDNRDYDFHDLPHLIQSINYILQ